MTVAARDAEIRTRLGDFEAGRINDWTGLPENLTLTECASVWSFDVTDQFPGSLGSEKVDSAYLYVSSSHYASGLRVWITEADRSAEEQLVLAVEGRHPRDEQGGLITAPDLHDPEATATARLGLLEFDEGELIFASRGLAVRRNPHNEALLGLIGFTPTTVADYVARLRPVDRAPRPQRIGVGR